jgi:hypothetical protein
LVNETGLYYDAQSEKHQIILEIIDILLSFPPPRTVEWRQISAQFTYLPTYLLTYSVEQSPSWEANKYSASQEIPRYLSLFWASSIQSMPPHPTSWRFILTLSSHLRLGLPSCLFPSGFLTKMLYTPLHFRIRATCPAHLFLISAHKHVLYSFGRLCVRLEVWHQHNECRHLYLAFSVQIMLSVKKWMFTH